MKKSLLIFSSLISATLISFSTPVFAQHGECKADREKFCKDVKPGGGAVIKCLRKHESELSPECKAKGDNLRDRARTMHEACKEDHEKFCAGKKGKEGRSCMQENKEKFSQSCKDAWLQK